MGVIDAPQWLLPAFTRSVYALGATADQQQVQESCEALLRRWSTPDRRFHNVRHVIDMLARVDELADESHNPDMIRVATWYHGCVFSLALRDTYRRNGGEDEVASAAEAARDLPTLGVPAPTVDRICNLILSLKRHNLVDDIDAMVLNDADLGTLAVNPQLYRSYRDLVRAEYEHIPDLDYYQARREIVTKLLSRDKLFASPLGARWELPARENLQSELRQIGTRLAELEATAPTAPAAGSSSTRSAVSAASADEGEHTSPQEPSFSAPPVLPERGRDVVSPVGAVTPRSAASAEPVVSPATAMSPASALSPGRVASPAEAGGQRRAEAQRDDLPRAEEPERDEPRPERPRHSGSNVHTTSMESCAEDLEELLGKPVNPASPRTRQELAEAHRAKVCQLVQAKSEAAKALRETRTAALSASSADLDQDEDAEES